jgi:hypothetical protein
VLQIHAALGVDVGFANLTVLALAFGISHGVVATAAKGPTSDFFSEMAKNLPELISRIKDNWLGLIALVLILTTFVIWAIVPQTERKRFSYIFVVGAMLLIASAFYEAVQQQNRLDSPPAVAQAASPQKPQPAANPEQTEKPPHHEDTHPAQQQWCPEDPNTKIAYSQDIAFRPGDPPYKTGRVRGGDSNTPGSEWIFNWTAPGPVYSVTARQTGWWEQIDFCTAQGNVAHCEGWINGGNAPIIATAKWKQPCPAVSQ